jgi:hypothetical protein
MWREKHPGMVPDFHEADLATKKMPHVNPHWADLGARKTGCELKERYGGNDPSRGFFAGLALPSLGSCSALTRPFQTLPQRHANRSINRSVQIDSHRRPSVHGVAYNG